MAGTGTGCQGESHQENHAAVHQQEGIGPISIESNLYATTYETMAEYGTITARCNMAQEQNVDRLIVVLKPLQRNL
jgi:hypothetical protein